MAYPTKLVSITKAGVVGNGASGINGSVSNANSGTVSQTDDMAAISQSSDGRFVVFTSAATNFYASDTNNYRDIFLKDMVTGTLTGVATSTTSSANFPEVSDDGRYVVFQHGFDIWRRDMTTPDLELVSKNVAGVQVSAKDPEMSNDGRYLVFNSSAGDAGGHEQVYLRDMQLGTTKLISVDSDGTTIGNGDSSNACVSEDGKFVVFQSKSSNFAAGNANAYEEIFMKDIETGALTRISETAIHGGGVTGASINATFSGNGRYVVFESAANDLDSITTMAGNSTIVSVIYRKDLLTGNVELVSEGKSGKASGWDSDPSISADGRFVLFKSHLGGAGDPALNNGVTPLSPNYYSYYYIKDMATGNVFNIDLPRGSLTMKISVAGHTATSPTTYSGLAPYESQNATISADGKHVTLSSTQTLSTGKITNYVSLNGTITPDDDLKGNNDGQFDVFSIDVSTIASKPAPAVIVTGTIGADIMVGKSGADTLKGGLGDDLYYVNLITSGAGAAVKAKFKELVVEAATNGSGNDTITLIGNITGLSKATLLSLAANVENLDASKTLNALLNLGGNAVANSMIGNNADNVLIGGAGADTLDGGAGNDTADYSASVAAVTITLGGVVSGGDATGDVLTSIENLTGSSKNDTLTGDDNANVLVGGGGNDSLNGGGGNDTLAGGAGADSLDGGVGTGDVLDYSTSLVAVRVDLTANTLTGGDAAGDVISGFENITGSAKNDALTGDTNANVLKGGAGNDTLDGGSGGSDDLYGGAGGDTYQINHSGVSIYEEVGEGIDVVSSSVDYTLAANLEKLTLTGSATIGAGNELANSITGTNGGNTLVGDGGADTLAGGDGNDTYIVNLVQVGTGATASVKLEDTVTEVVNQGNDTLQLMGSVVLSKATTLALAATLENFNASNTGSTLLNLTGNSAANSMVGNNADNILIGGAGADTLDGGAGNDTADYSTSVAAVTITLGGMVSGGDATGDVLTSIENLTGSGKSDLLTGDGNANVLIGGLGNDTLSGGDGNDTLLGGAGADALDGGAGTGDTMDYSTSAVAVKVNLALNTASGGDATGDALSNFENIVGSAKNDVLTGDASANVLKGGVGNDTLDGGSGDDVLVGGGGNDNLTGRIGGDTFVFNSALPSNVDHITDFSHDDDVIYLSKSVFTSLGNLNESVGAAFHAGAGLSAATSPTDRIIYNSLTGDLYYDADGKGGTSAVKFAVLDGHPTTVDSSDFIVIA